MKTARLVLLASLSFSALVGLAASSATYTAVPDWLKLPEGRTQLGNQHGDVAVASNGEVYVSVMDPKAGLQVFSPDGKWLRNVPGAPPDFHGFVIHKEADGEFIYGARLGAGNILKMKLDGTVLLDIPPSVIPDQYKNKGKIKGKNGEPDKEGPPATHLTAMDVAPNGDLYVTDGYGSDYVHHFDKTGKYLGSFGGKKEPYSFATLHKIAIDTRFSPPRIIGVDRAHGRVVHMSLDGQFLGVVAKDLLLPAAVCIYKDEAIIGEIKGRVTVLDKEGKIVSQFGANDHADETGTNKTEPAKWRTGFVTAPHGVAVDANGDVYVSEYSLFGRVHRFDLK
jgi:hypothetical protein